MAQVAVAPTKEGEVWCLSHSDRLASGFRDQTCDLQFLDGVHDSMIASPLCHD